MTELSRMIVTLGEYKGIREDGNSLTINLGIRYTCVVCFVKKTIEYMYISNLCIFL